MNTHLNMKEKFALWAVRQILDLFDIALTFET